jgi:hypothetical protein
MPAGTKDDPWELSTPPRTSTYTMWADETADPPTLFCQVGSTQLRYQLRSIDDLHAWLVEQDDWVDLGAADEQKPAKEGTVEAWDRSEDNPVGGWYGLRKGYRGRFGMYLPHSWRLSVRPSSLTSRATTKSAPSSECLVPTCQRLGGL